MIDFWKWLFTRNLGTPGICKFWDRWLILHLSVGCGLAWCVPISLVDAAKAVLLPLAGIFVGLSFAWGGNAVALLQTEEIEDLTKQHPTGFRNYVFTFLLSILAILITLVGWGLAGLEIFDKSWPTSASPKAYFSLASALYFGASITMRECWHVVLGAQFLLLARRRIRINKQIKDDQK